MKMRSGFVSNSSSSSFVIATEYNKKPSIMVYIPLEVESVMRTVADVEEHFSNWYGDDWRSEEYLVARYNEYVKQIADGNILYLGSIDQSYLSDCDGINVSHGKIIWEEG